MFSPVLIIFLSVVISPTSSAAGDNCMVLVMDLSSTFGQDGAASTTALSESSGQTNETCLAKCCQTETCNVVLFTTGENETDSQCRMFACRPLTSCSFHQENGQSVFISQGQGEVTTNADTATITATPIFDVADTETTGATPTLEVTTTPGTSSLPKDLTTSQLSSAPPREDVVTTSVATVTQQRPSNTAPETNPSSLKASGQAADAPTTTVHSTVSDPEDDVKDDVATTLPATISSSSATVTQPDDAPPSVTQLLVETSRPSPTSNTTNSGQAASTEQSEAPLPSDLEISSSSTTTTISSSFSSTSLSPSSSSSPEQQSPISQTSQQSQLTSTQQQDLEVPDKTVSAQVSTLSATTSSVSPISNLSESLNQAAPSSSSSYAPYNTTSTFHLTTPPDTSSSSVNTSFTSTTKSDATEPSANQISVVLTGHDATTTSSPHHHDNVTNSFLLNTTANKLPPAKSSMDTSNTLHTNDSTINLIMAEANQRLTNETLTDGETSEGAPQAIVVILAITLALGCVFLLVVVGVLGRRVYDGYQKRHYSRLDYLINGMYS